MELESNSMTRRTVLSFAIVLAARPELLAAASVYDYDLETIDYRKLHLRDFKGKVLMIVNVASRCGYTPQYAGLQQLYLRYKDQGLVIIGIPSDDFGQGEPGSNPEIQQFCRRKYDVTFPMMSKSLINVNPRLPIYEYLTDGEQNPRTAGPIKWNFTKFLISRDGKIINRFEPATEPNDVSLVSAVEGALRQ
jgi:glutathione peroxidase